MVSVSIENMVCLGGLLLLKILDFFGVDYFCSFGDIGMTKVQTGVYILLAGLDATTFLKRV